MRNILNIRSVNKKILFFIWLLMTVHISCIHENQPKRIQVFYTHWSTTSSEPISCENFELAFKSILKHKNIENEELLKKFYEYTNTMEPIEEDIEIDVRIKCLIEYSQKTDTICISNGGQTILNGVPVKNNHELVEFVRQLVYN